jgi:hypothetical protein
VLLIFSNWYLFQSLGFAKALDFAKGTITLHSVCLSVCLL